MKKIRKVLWMILVIALVTALVACQEKSTEKVQAEQQGIEEKPVTLLVSAAASLTEAMEEIKGAYAQERPQVEITYNFGSSGSLQQQIEQGAGVDVFLSAATKQMNGLQEKGLIIEDTRKDFLENKVVLVVPKDSTAVSSFEDLATDKLQKIGLGEPQSVPVGQYAEEILTNLKIKDKVQSKAVYGKDVKQVLSWVETGNVDGGIVYGTDAQSSDKVKIVETAPEETHKPVYYPAAVIKTTKNEKEAKDFVNFLYSDKAKSIFEKYGFVFNL
ncbi:MAG: molybdate ABC transporter substrate-binding protein [Thermotaleaceae bacterium]